MDSDTFILIHVASVFFFLSFFVNSFDLFGSFVFINSVRKIQTKDSFCMLLDIWIMVSLQQRIARHTEKKKKRPSQ